ncbi:MAG: hypothetical protein JGK24_19375 [Microcoleus sp. PH2017_29_MFU_D_A]|uniref:hypothetical protein n=1 Tax=unclassified Microcoleus TaxID=2642155 RepID=UPI001D800645|nr:MULTISPECIES: hypothetical protein [unclassified Microcoleus]MCC3416995.1 hypothetical protein [Microcoleus sp. PH2017_07_MST_O_A]MCC3430338.1 hypothetical protein [Microcoleus sp. PH2017_04_SCI_O_A]MCC3444290.1 hypothetical protein [Microcoleus sp. PH2017_03_ELD_O_A]MCC3465143.1 hypothetical protein [Microcoleus sp. PH2017_06_SFM_O_A]MCC3503261.1 hypothetical protein [Microcoleus sp. PH2017_19_SFW_U_A]MCC3509383.1 hypothetical protein [Microcoleus sp. PH2017_17_BER_D_A]
MTFWNFPAYLGAIGYKLTEKLLAQGKVFIAKGRRKFGNEHAIGIFKMRSVRKL